MYVHGTATRVGDREFGGNDFEIVAAVDDGHEDADLFLLSDCSEDDLVSARRDAVLYLGSGVLLAVIGLGLVAGGLFPVSF